jgi:hypothetical protein
MPRIPQPPSLESKSPKFGDKDPTTVACRLKMTTCKITKTMVQMIGIRLLIRKIAFFGRTNPEKMTKRISNPNNPSNDPSDLEYSRK